MAAFLFRLHRWVGLGAALFLCLIGLTGALLVCHEGIDGLLRPRAFHVAPQGNKLPLDVLVERARQAWPDYEVFAASVENRDRPGAAFLLRLHGGDEFPTAALDPYTGAPLGLRVDRTTRWVLRLHEGFLLHDGGRAAAFFLGAGLVLLALTGLAVCRGRWLALARFPRAGRGQRAYLADLHTWVGFYALLFNLVLGFTGAWMDYPALVRVLHGTKPGGRNLHCGPAAVPLEKALAAAREALPGLQPALIVFPSAPGGPLRVLGDLPGAWFSNHYSSAVVLDAASGAVGQVRDFRRLGGGEKLQALIVPLHFGDFGGWPVKAVYVLGGLTPVVLSVSGCAIWLSRRRSGPIL